MKVTSAQAAKLLRKCNDELSAIRVNENAASTFLARMGEDIEAVRPDYDYEAVQQKIAEINAKIRKIKHTLNVFNATTVVPEFGMTIDEMLIYIPQLTRRKHKLSNMKDVLPKTREMSHNSRTNILDYRYTNYDVDKVKADYSETSDMLANAQTALDYVNNTVEMELDI